ncbi:beta-galactosidase trimerization domain-containing protein [Paenibacillus sonchi]|uniref:beta-galactosidase trimerization domain-containing protein n=1 Tax=Paenibacillus sonchi TaxID=373687 RepID=UPI00398AE0EA
MAWYEDDFFAGAPAVTVNRFGAGKLYYIGTHAGEGYTGIQVHRHPGSGGRMASLFQHPGDKGEQHGLRIILQPCSLLLLGALKLITVKQIQQIIYAFDFAGIDNCFPAVRVPGHLETPISVFHYSHSL